MDEFDLDELSDSELQTRLVNRGMNSDEARLNVEHVRLGCEVCIEDTLRQLD